MVPVLANIWFKDNGYNLVIDWRFFKYPQDTYGLGGHSDVDDADNIDYQHLRLHQSVMKRIGNSFYVGVGYFLDYRWNIKENGDNNDVKDYGLTRTSMSSGPVAIVSYDSRKNSINPENGLYANLQYRPNMTSLGSSNNWQSLVTDIRKYVNFPGGSRNVLAFWNYNWLTLSGKPPYLDLPGTGWDPSNNTARGYIQGRFRSLNMLYAETEYRFALTQNGLLGGVVFVNAQSLSNWPVAKYDRIIPATGLGIRVKVNKTSRTNIAVDYGFGVKGSRGLFVNLGEVF
jgi:outer membrane translocation and assembly module TamA